MVVQVADNQGATAFAHFTMNAGTATPTTPTQPSSGGGGGGNVEPGMLALFCGLFTLRCRKMGIASRR